MTPRQRVATWTGSRDIPPEVAPAVREIVELAHADLHISGACIGVDQFVATTLLEVQPESRQRIIVPRNRQKVDLDWLAEMRAHPNVEVIFMPSGTTYFDRNLALLGEPFNGLRNSDAIPRTRPDMVVGLPRWPAGVARSGSWWTIRAAQRAGIGTMVVPLSELLGQAALAEEWGSDPADVSSLP